MSARCLCAASHSPRLVVLTGGPGAGKTAVLEVVRRELCRHVAVLPESASILWRGQFPRGATTPARKAAQRAIAKVQTELQRMTIEEGQSSLILCDRGTLDGLAYWPGDAAEYFEDLQTTRERELGRYAAVIHMRTPLAAHGYVANGYRIETAEEAAAIDERVLLAWSGHPRRYIVDSKLDFLIKLSRGLELIRREVPACCRLHATDVPAIPAEPLQTM